MHKKRGGGGRKTNRRVQINSAKSWGPRHRKRAGGGRVAGKSTDGFKVTTGEEEVQKEKPGTERVTRRDPKQREESPLAKRTKAGRGEEEDSSKNDAGWRGMIRIYKVRRNTPGNAVILLDRIGVGEKRGNERVVGNL